MTSGTVADAIAYALNDLGVKVLTHVPGFGGSETFQSFKNIGMKNPPISFNEEVAFSIAHGGSMVGQRAALLTKSQGLISIKTTWKKPILCTSKTIKTAVFVINTSVY